MKKRDHIIENANCWIRKWLPVRDRTVCERHLNKYGLTLTEENKAAYMESWIKKRAGC